MTKSVELPVKGQQRIVMETAQPRSGFLSSEFAGRIGILALAGYLIYSGQSAEELTGRVSEVYESIKVVIEKAGGIAGMLAAVWSMNKYGKDRTKLKRPPNVIVRRR